MYILSTTLKENKDYFHYLKVLQNKNLNKSLVVKTEEVMFFLIKTECNDNNHINHGKKIKIMIKHKSLKTIILNNY